MCQEGYEYDLRRQEDQLPSPKCQEGYDLRRPEDQHCYDLRKQEGQDPRLRGTIASGSKKARPAAQEGFDPRRQENIGCQMTTWSNVILPQYLFLGGPNKMELLRI